MKARTILFVTAMALVAVAPWAIAQMPTTDPAAAPEAPLTPAAVADELTAPIIEGLVVSVGNTSLVINADDGTTRTFVIDTATMLPAVEVISGSRVVIRYKPLDGDRAQALSISEAPATSAAAPVPPGSAVPAAPAPVSEPFLVSPVILGIAGLVVLAVIVWMVTRRRTDEAFHIS
jgi:hypothetical protein